MSLATFRKKKILERKKKRKILVKTRCILLAGITAVNTIVLVSNLKASTDFTWNKFAFLVDTFFRISHQAHIFLRFKKTLSRFFDYFICCVLTFEMNLYCTSLIYVLYNENWTFILHRFRPLHSHSNAPKGNI